jgi:hypothetical protein
MGKVISGVSVVNVISFPLVNLPAIKSDKARIGWGEQSEPNTSNRTIMPRCWGSQTHPNLCGLFVRRATMEMRAARANQPSGLEGQG